MARPWPLLLLALVAALASTAAQNGATLTCSEDADCDTEGARCLGGVCACPLGGVMTTDLTRCLQGAAELGAPCEDAVQCVSRLLVGGTCAPSEVIASVLPTPAPKDECQCAQGYHYLRGRCWRSAGLGEACKHAESCHVNHDSESVTCSANKCDCAEGFYRRGEPASCRRISTAFGQECGVQPDCQYPNSACTNRRCDCASGYEYNKDDKTCFAAASPTDGTIVDDGGGSDNSALVMTAIKSILEALGLTGGDGGDQDGDQSPTDASPTAAPDVTTCETAADCGEHSDCNGGACVCQRGYFRLQGETSCHPELLQACERDADCSMRNATCREAGPSGSGAVCSCQGGYIASEDMRLCRKMSSALGWSCLHDAQCGLFGPGGRCEDKQCSCAEGHHWEPQLQYCWLSRAVNETCSGEEDCSALGGGALCAEGRCLCGPDHHSSSDGLACRQDAIGLGAACEVSEDCVTESTACTAGKCACEHGFMVDDSGTACRPGVGGPCSTGKECGVQGSTCYRNICSCPQDMVASQAGDACLAALHQPGDQCSETAQCSHFKATCENGTCACGSEQHFRDGQCRRKRDLGESCRSSGECFLEGAPDKVECRNSVCKCRFEFLDVNDGLHCTRSSGHSHGRVLAASFSLVSITALLVLL